MTVLFVRIIKNIYVYILIPLSSIKLAVLKCVLLETYNPIKIAAVYEQLFLLFSTNYLFKVFEKKEYINYTTAGKVLQVLVRIVFQKYFHCLLSCYQFILGTIFHLIFFRMLLVILVPVNMIYFYSS